MNCQRCQSSRLISVNAKCSDCCFTSSPTQEIDGYVPRDLGIGGGDYVDIRFCMHCGQLQGKWPRLVAAIEDPSDDKEAE